MKKILILILVLGVFATPVSVLAAGTVKVKYLGSIYTDPEGEPLTQPTGVVFIDNRLLVVDSGGKRIVSYIYNDGQVKPDKSYDLPERFPLMAQAAPDGGLYVLDVRAREIVMLGPTGEVTGKFSPKGLPGEDRMVPRSIKAGPGGLLLVLDVFSERVLVFNGSSEFQRQVPFPETYGAIADLTMDAQGSLYLLDSVEAVVYKARSQSDKFEALTESMKEMMNFPASLSVDRQGNLYLVDKYGSGLDVVTPDGRYAGRKLSMGWSDSFLFYPGQVSVTESGDLFIADTGNRRAQHFTVEE